MLTYEEAALLMMAGEGADSTIGSSQVYRDILETGIPAATIKVTDRFKYVVMIWEDKKHFFGQKLDALAQMHVEDVRYEPDVDPKYHPNGYKIAEILAGHLSFHPLNPPRYRFFHVVSVLYDGDNPVVARKEESYDTTKYADGYCRQLEYDKTLARHDPDLTVNAACVPIVKNVYIRERNVYGGDISVQYSGDFIVDSNKLINGDDYYHWNKDYSNNLRYLRYHGTVPLINADGTTPSGNGAYGGFEIIGKIPVIWHDYKQRPQVHPPWNPEGLVEDIRVEPERNFERDYVGETQLWFKGPQDSSGFNPYLSGKFTVYSDKSVNELIEVDFQIWKSLVEIYNDGVFTTVNKDIKLM